LQNVGSASHGSLSLDDKGNLDYQPEDDFTGIDQVTYTVASWEFELDFPGYWHPYWADAQIVIQVGQQNAPTANDDSYGADSIEGLNISAAEGLLANDVDVDSETTAGVVDPPAHGTVSLGSDGGFQYTPTSGYVGQDSFTYQNNKNGLLSNVATV